MEGSVLPNCFKLDLKLNSFVMPELQMVMRDTGGLVEIKNGDSFDWVGTTELIITNTHTGDELFKVVTSKLTGFKHPLKFWADKKLGKLVFLTGKVYEVLTESLKETFVKHMGTEEEFKARLKAVKTEDDFKSVLKDLAKADSSVRAEVELVQHTTDAITLANRLPKKVVESVLKIEVAEDAANEFDAKISSLDIFKLFDKTCMFGIKIVSGPDARVLN